MTKVCGKAAPAPRRSDTAEAERVVAACEQALPEGRDRALLDGHLIETPSYQNARALVARARLWTH